MTTLNSTLNTAAKNENAQEAITKTILDNMETLKKRSNVTEVIQTQFRCMEGFATLPKNLIKDYLTSEGLNDTSSGSGNIAFSGEIFSSAQLKPLTDIRTKVNATMQTYGVLIGTSGSYVINVTDHKAVIAFLENMKIAYQSHLDSLLDNYDTIIANHATKLSQEIKNEAVVKTLMDKFPTKEELEKKNKCSYQVFTSRLPTEDEVNECSQSIISALEALEEQDLAFLGKITDPFKEFNRCFDDAKTGNILGKKPSAFNRAVDTVLSSERTVRTILSGSKYEEIIDTAYDLVKKLKNKLCMTLNTKERKTYETILMQKYKIASYVLSSPKRIEDYAQGKIDVIDDAFSLKGELALSETFKAQPQSVISHAQATCDNDDNDSAVNEYLQSKFEENKAKASAQSNSAHQADLFSEDLFNQLEAEVADTTGTTSVVQSEETSVSVDFRLSDNQHVNTVSDDNSSVDVDFGISDAINALSELQSVNETQSDETYNSDPDISEYRLF